MSIQSRRGNQIPYEVEGVLVAIGRNLRTARLRRNLTLDNVAKRIGVHRTTLALAEKGDPTVMVGTYVTALWVYGLTAQATEIGAPDRDPEGRALEAARGRTRARPVTDGMSNDF